MKRARKLLKDDIADRVITLHEDVQACDHCTLPAGHYFQDDDLNWYRISLVEHGGGMLVLDELKKAADKRKMQ